MAKDALEKQGNVVLEKAGLSSKKKKKGGNVRPLTLAKLLKQPASVSSWKIEK